MSRIRLVLISAGTAAPIGFFGGYYSIPPRPTAPIKTFIMPWGLDQFGASLGCAQIDDFYRHMSSPHDAVFAYGYSRGRPENSAVFWCTAEAAPPERILVYFENESLADPELLKCPRSIGARRNSLGGLSFRYDPNGSLDRYTNLKTGKPISPGLKQAHNAIFVHTTDESVSWYYCHDGEWFISSGPED